MVIEYAAAIILMLICLASGYYLGYSEGFRFGYSKCLEHNSKKVKKVFKK